MRLYEKEVTIPVLPDHKGLLSHIDQALRFRLADGASPLRFVVTETDAEHYQCEIGVMSALRAGIVPGSVRRPLASTAVEHKVHAATDERPTKARQTPS